ncbi:MAG: heme-binding protein [Nitrospirota bacterium]|nr:heme-binding protein [Nitrospinota bacterium]MDH5588052.1 heme-binding protein [Nitrospirota bacterium]MDH5775432.1 heme-binding protein [Nitrospirota bacterium]
MKTSSPLLFLFLSVVALSGCSMFGHSGVEIAPYEILEKEDALELRHYERLVLVTTAMPSGMNEQSDSFYKLFDYISGKNESTKKIPMTAPVFLDQADEATEFMSFVLPESFSIETAPLPQDPAVKLEEIVHYTVAAITFSGSLNQEAINTHRIILEEWIARKGFKKRGAAKAAGYNPPFTIPALRRNEVLIPIIKP